MRFMYLLSMSILCSLTACAAPLSTEEPSAKDKALAEKWADKVKKQEEPRPVCSFNKDGIGACHYQ